MTGPPTSAISGHYPQLVVCKLTKQGHRFLTSLTTTDLECTIPIGPLGKFVSSSSKHVALTTLAHLLSPTTAQSHPRISSLALPLYAIIRNETWFSWNSKLVADLIALLYKQERFEEAEILFAETVSKLGFKERELCLFYCYLVYSHAKHRSKDGVANSCTKLRRLILLSSSVYVKRKGYESMISGFCEIGLPGKAEDLIEEMKQVGLKPSMFEFRCIIYSYGQMGFLQDMKRSAVGLELDTVCCNMVLSSLGAHNELLDMVLWLKKMRDSDIPFSIRTYNSVLNSCLTIISLLEHLKTLPLKIDELADKLNQDEATVVTELLKSPVLHQVMEWKPSDQLKLDLHGMHLSTAYIVLLQWFDELGQRFAAANQETPTEILVVCGCGKHSSTRGESPVKDLVKEVVRRMQCPLRIDRNNIGCFIAKGKTFKDWYLPRYQSNSS